MFVICNDEIKDHSIKNVLTLLYINDVLVCVTLFKKNMHMGLSGSQVLFSYAHIRCHMHTAQMLILLLKCCKHIEHECKCNTCPIHLQQFCGHRFVTEVALKVGYRKK